jgi:hypothetical protein
MIHYILYVSCFVKNVTENELFDMLYKFRQNNIRNEITGLLACKGRSVMQYFEGPEAKVNQLFQNIINDSRHWHIKIFLKGSMPNRLFGKWAMAFETEITSQEVSSYLESKGNTDLTFDKKINTMFNTFKNQPN